MERGNAKCRLFLGTAYIIMFFFIPFAHILHAASTSPVVVYAAASTTNAVREITDLFERTKNICVKTSFASSSTLAKQIQSGAPADVYISANKKWMDFLDEKKLIAPASRFDLLSNRIVLVAPADSQLKIDIRPGLDLSRILGDRRLAMGDPTHVPAGIYGKQALETLGAWAGVRHKIAPSKDVRSALVLVERGEVPLGLVYATDAAITDKVKIIAMFPRDAHPPIVYPVALVHGRELAGPQAFIVFLKTTEAKDIFTKYGFSVR